MKAYSQLKGQILTKGNTIFLSCQVKISDVKAVVSHISNAG